MLRFDDPLFVDRLYVMSGQLTTEVQKALESVRYTELARLKGVQQGLILAIEMARGGSGRVPQEHDTPFLSAAIATLHKNDANELLANTASATFSSIGSIEESVRKLHERVRTEAERQEAARLATGGNAKSDG